MKNSVVSLLPKIVLPLSLLSGAVTPVYAAYSDTVSTTQRLNIGSHANPDADNVRGSWFYPEESLKRNEQGKVTVKVFLDADGDAKDAVVEQSSGFPKLDEAALAYVKERYDYDPAPGERMPEFVRTIINFKTGLVP